MQRKNLTHFCSSSFYFNIKIVIIFFYFSGTFWALRSLLFHNWCSGKLKPYCRIIYETKGFYLFPRERHQTVAVLWQFSSFVSRRFPLLELADLIGKGVWIDFWEFCSVWADNADACSTQYAGTGALKTDYTRFVLLLHISHYKSIIREEQPIKSLLRPICP